MTATLANPERTKFRLDDQTPTNYPDRADIIWLTDGQLETVWTRDVATVALAAGNLATANNDYSYLGGNCGDQPFIPSNIVRGYD